VIVARVQHAIVQAFGEAMRDTDPNVTAATRPEFGDYQCNAAMALAKRLNTRPHAIADDIVMQLDVRDICYPPDIAGPGFINLRLKDEFVSMKVARMLADPKRLAIAK
jgi:arginyl-tRNA synthetase